MQFLNSLNQPKLGAYMTRQGTDAETAGSFEI